MPQLTARKQRSASYYTLREEIANAVTHGVGALLALAGAIVLLVRAALHGDTRAVVSFAIYGASMVILYLASTLYHGVQQPRLKHWLRVFDHAAIYVLIAGTYTPFLLVGLRGERAWTLLAVVWGLALLGIGYKMLFIGRHEAVATAGYVLMGWMAVIILRDLVAQLPPAGMILLGAGGVAYTAGVVFFAWTRLPYNHAIWHLFVLAGSACHFFAVLHLLPVG